MAGPSARDASVSAKPIGASGSGYWGPHSRPAVLGAVLQAAQNAVLGTVLTAVLRAVLKAVLQAVLKV